MLSNYYLSLARSMMMDAQAKLEKADEYFALATRDSAGYGLQRRMKVTKGRLRAELDRTAALMADPEETKQ